MLIKIKINFNFNDENLNLIYSQNPIVSNESSSSHENVSILTILNIQMCKERSFTLWDCITTYDSDKNLKLVNEPLSFTF